MSCTYGRVDELGDATAVHREADVGWMTAKAAAMSHPRQCQHCCHDNQLHPLSGCSTDTCHKGGSGPTSDMLND